VSGREAVKVMLVPAVKEAANIYVPALAPVPVPKADSVVPAVTPNPTILIPTTSAPDVKLATVNVVVPTPEPITTAFWIVASSAVLVAAGSDIV